MNKKISMLFVAVLLIGLIYPVNAAFTYSTVKCDSAFLSRVAIADRFQQINFDGKQYDIDALKDYNNKNNFISTNHNECIKLTDGTGVMTTARYLKPTVKCTLVTDNGKVISRIVSASVKPVYTPNNANPGTEYNPQTGFCQGNSVCVVTNTGSIYCEQTKLFASCTNTIVRKCSYDIFFKSGFDQCVKVDKTDFSSTIFYR